MAEKKKVRKGTFTSSLVDEFKNHKVTFSVYFVLRLIVIGFAVFSVIRGQWENLFTCFLTLVLLLVPAFVSKSFKVNLRTRVTL